MVLRRRFVHILLTRFSVKIAGGTCHDRQWLEERFALFDRFCFPSVCTQSCQNFQWLCFFDVRLPADLRARVARYAREFPRFRPIFVHDWFRQSTAQHTVAPFLSGLTHLISTRLDNDDALATGFVETVQSRFEAQSFEFLNVRKGFIFSNNTVYRWEEAANPFISLVEKVDAFQTVLCGAHASLGRLGYIQQIIDQPGWLQVVHGRNIANTVRGPRAEASEWSPFFSIYPACLAAPAVTHRALSQVSA
jgi:hypothetical protein